MSLTEWKKEFYPKPANKVSKKDALAHSLKKWEGLLVENLVRFDLWSASGYIMEMNAHNKSNKELAIDSTTCALCIHYIIKEEYVVDSCEICPLYKVRGTRCDRDKGNERSSPYKSFITNENAMPMYKLLLKAMKREKKI